MKLSNRNIFNLKAICFFLLLILISGSFKTSTNFQKDADILRLRHLRYYSKLLSEYNNIVGKYPFQGQSNLPTYVHIANQEQIEFKKKAPPYPHEVIPFEKFVTEIETVLGREINEYYDPQYYPDYKPNFYIYLIYHDTYFLAVHVHQPFPFTKKVAEHYYKVELSNHPNQYNKAIFPQNLLNSPEFNIELNKPINKPGFFRERENKYLHSTKSKIRSINE